MAAQIRFLGALARSCWSRLASSVAAASISRLRRPTSGFEYLLAMHLALFGDADLPLHRARRLGEDRLVARAAAAADRAAAAVEQAQA